VTRKSAACETDKARTERDGDRLVVHCDGIAGKGMCVNAGAPKVDEEINDA